MSSRYLKETYFIHEICVKLIFKANRIALPIQNILWNIFTLCWVCKSSKCLCYFLWRDEKDFIRNASNTSNPMLLEKHKNVSQSRIFMGEGLVCGISWSFYAPTTESRVILVRHWQERVYEELGVEAFCGVILLWVEKEYNMRHLRLLGDKRIGVCIIPLLLHGKNHVLLLHNQKHQSLKKIVSMLSWGENLRFGGWRNLMKTLLYRAI